MQIKTIKYEEIDFNNVDYVSVGYIDQAKKTFFLAVCINNEHLIVEGTETDNVYQISESYTKMKKLVKDPKLKTYKKSPFEELSEQINK